MIKTVEEKADLRNILKPLLVFMKMLGLYYDPEKFKYEAVKQLNIEGNTIQNRNFSRNVLWKGYTIFALILAWLIIVKVVVAFILDLEIGLSLFVTAGYSLQSSLEATILFKMFRDSERFHQFVKSWNAFVLFAFQNGCNQPEVARKLRRTFIIYYVVFGAVFILMLFAFFFIGFGPVSEVNRQVLSGMIAPFPTTTPYKIISGIVLAFILNPWLCTIVLFGSITSGLTYQFQRLGEAIENTCKNSPHKFPESLPALRRTHLMLCDLVDLAEKDFKHILAVAYTLNIIISLILGYKLIKSDWDPLNFSVLVFWMVCNIMKVSVLSCSSATLNREAQLPLSALYKVNTNGITLEESVNLDMFIKKLQGTDIGFTVWDFLVVRRDTILTLIGVFLTYFFILVQFNFPAET